VNESNSFFRGVNEKGTISRSPCSLGAARGPLHRFRKRPSFGSPSGQESLLATDGRYLPRLVFREQVGCTASALFAAPELRHYKGRGLNRGGRSAFDQLDIVEAGFFRFIALARDGYDATICGDEPPSPSVCMIIDGEVSRMHRPLPGLPLRRAFSVRHRGEQYNQHLNGQQPRPVPYQRASRSHISEPGGPV
jgi:hypothetical protein